MENNKGPILHVLVVGFHHKKGCQVEYSYPPLVPGHPNECPLGWKYLPTLALPDGSHNYDADTAFFHLPSLTNPKKTIFGISCFRQIPVEKLKNRTDDITRGTVQKSVCVLSSLPLYGHIEVKMSLITHAYFDEGDFSKVSLLEDTYHHLNACLTQNHSPHQNFVGLSARDFILQWRHKAVLLYKLMLLERKIIFFKSPVQPLCTTILTLLSLHPGMIEDGLEQSACIKLSRPMSPMPDFDDDQYDNIASTNRNSENIPTLVNGSHFISSSNNNLTQLQPLCTSENQIETVDLSLSNQIVENHFDVHRTSEDDEEKIENNNKTQVVIVENHIQHVTNDDRLETNEDMLDTCQNINKQKTIDSCSDSIENTNKTNEHHSETLEYNIKTNEHHPETAEHTNKTIEHRSNSIENINKTNEYRSDSIENTNNKTIEHPSETLENTNETCELGENNLETIELSTTPTDDKKTNDTSPSPIPNFPAFPLLPLSSLGLPLPIFTSGYLCLPYLSLPYIDFLADPAVRGYLLGATNVLFKQKPRLGDVLVELDTQRVELLAGGDQDQDLRKAMHLTTEDLRFADYVVKNVQEQRDVFLDGVGYEGGEEWIREQFKGYLMCLLRTSLLQDGCREMEHFNSTFISLWKDTHNYKSWMMTPHPGILELNPGHPFAGQLSVADMKLRLSHTMQNTEGGRKLNQAVMSTGRAVGGAISQARGAITNWWSNLLVSPEGKEIDIPEKE